MERIIDLNRVNIAFTKPDGETAIENFSKNGETEYGEPQIWIPLSDGTSLEITHEMNGLKPSMQFITMRHHCNESDFDEATYGDTNGIIASFKYADNKQLCNGLTIFLTNMSKKGICVQ